MRARKTIAQHIVPGITAAAEQAGRDKAPEVVASAPVCVTDDLAGARARAGEVLAMYGYLPSYRAMLDREGAAGPADVTIAGTEAGGGGGRSGVTRRPEPRSSSP